MSDKAHRAKLPPRYWQVILLMVLCICLAVLAGWSFFRMQGAVTQARAFEAQYDALSAQVARLAASVQGLAQDRADAQDMPAIILRQTEEDEDEQVVDTLAGPIAAATDRAISDAIQTMQSQFEGHASQMNFLFAVLGIAITVFTLAVPFMNYGLLTKDLVQPLREEFARAQASADKVDAMYEEMERRQAVLEDTTEAMMGRLRNAVRNVQELIVETAVGLSGVDKEYNLTPADEIVPLSDAPEDLAFAECMRIWVAVRKRDMEGALAHACRAIALAPEEARGYKDRGTIYGLLGRHEEALEDNTTALKMRPGDAEYLAARSVSLHWVGDYEASLVDMTQAIKKDPENAFHYHNRAWTYAALRRYDEALADMEQALALEPGNVRCQQSKERIEQKKAEYESTDE